MFMVGGISVCCHFFHITSVFLIFDIFCFHYFFMVGTMAWSLDNDRQMGNLFWYILIDQTYVWFTEKINTFHRHTDELGPLTRRLGDLIPLFLPGQDATHPVPMFWFSWYSGRPASRRESHKSGNPFHLGRRLFSAPENLICSRRCTEGLDNEVQPCLVNETGTMNKRYHAFFTI